MKVTTYRVLAFAAYFLAILGVLTHQTEGAIVTLMIAIFAQNEATWEARKSHE